MYKAEKKGRRKRFKLRLVFLGAVALSFVGFSVVLLNPKNTKADESQTQALIEINASNFPDEKFRAYILEEVDGKYGDSQKDGNLTEKEIAFVNRLDLKKRGIQELKGIEIFKDSLSMLDISNNPLKESPSFKEFSKLQVFDFMKTELAQMPELPDNIISVHIGGAFDTIPKLPQNLKSLYIEDPVSSLPNPLPSQLTSLGIYGKNITSLSDLPDSITFLGCSKINIKNIDRLPSKLESLECIFNNSEEISSLPKTLTSLDFEYGNIESLDLTGFTALNGLACRYSNIKEIKNIPSSLKCLWAADNLLESLDLRGTQITDLFCENNELTSIDVSGLSLLKFHCYNNRLSSKSAVKGFSNWDDNNFKFGTQRIGAAWKDIALSDECKEIVANWETTLLIHTITDPGQKPFYIQESKIIYEIEGENPTEAVIKKKENSPNRAIIAKKSGEINLKVTIKNYKGNGENFVKIFKIKVVDGQGSPSGEVITDKFKDENFLKEIRRALKKFPNADIYTGDPLDKIRHIHLESNKIKDLSGIEYLTDLDSLYVSGTYLTELPENLPDSIRTIQCLNNNITCVKKLPKQLRHLDFRNNKNLKKIDATLPNSLKKLEVDGCSLIALPELPNGLEELTIVGNKLTTLPKLPVSLVKLEVSNNQLKSLDLTGLNKLSGLSCAYNLINSKEDIKGFEYYWDGYNYIYYPQQGGFGSVEKVNDIEGILSSGKSPIYLKGRIVSNTDVKKDIHWIVVNANNTGAKIVGNLLTAHSDGEVTVKGIIYRNRFFLGSLNDEQLYSKEFKIYITGDGTSNLPNDGGNTGNSGSFGNNSISGWNHVESSEGNLNNSSIGTSRNIENKEETKQTESYNKKKETINQNREKAHKNSESNEVKINSEKKNNLSIPKSKLTKVLKEKKALLVQLKKVAVKIDKKTIQNKINVNDKLNVSVKNSNIEKVKLSDKDKSKLLDKRVYHINVKLNGREFSEKFSVSISKELKGIGKNGVFIKDLNTGKVFKAKYDKKTKSILFKINKPGKFILLKK